MVGNAYADKPDIFKHYALDRETIAISKPTEKAVSDIFGEVSIEPIAVPTLSKVELTQDTPQLDSNLSWLINAATTMVGDASKLALTKTVSATKSGAKATLDATVGFADWGVRTAVAYNAAYYSSELIEWGLTKAVGCAVTLAMGPAAGAGAEVALQTAFTVGHYVVPGYESLAAWAATPFVKPVTDYALNKTPGVLKGVWSKSKSVANYFWG